MKIITALPDLNAITTLTWFSVAQAQLNSYGFFAMMMFGAVYFIVPRVTGIEWPLQKAVRAHFWLAAIGIVILALPLAIGGIIQGIQLNNPGVPFMDLTNGTLHFLRVSTIGDLLILLGHLLLASNLIALSVRYCRVRFLPVCKEVIAPLQTAEVKP